MNGTWKGHFRSLSCATAAAATLLLILEAAATPWNPMSTLPPNGVRGAGIPAPVLVPGKEWSHVRDRDELGVPDVEQQLAWDGLGGGRDAFDYSGSRPPNLDIDIETDALASGGDALFQDVEDDLAALLFSVSGSGSIFAEEAVGRGNPAFSAFEWATPLDIDNMFPPVDLDGLEIWGADQQDDADRYSVAGDPFFITPAAALKVAVWSYDPIGMASTPHTFTAELAMAMDRQYGFGGTGPLFGQLVELMDVDALMANGERLLYSIAPLPLSMFDPQLPDFDGGEIFVYDGPSSTTRFLRHGGHLWDTAFDIVGTYANIGVLNENVNAIEGVALPEPAGLVLAMLAAIASVGVIRIRRKRR